MSATLLLNGCRPVLPAQEEFDRLFEALLRPGTSPDRTPTLHTGEDAENFYVQAVVPGIDPAAIAVSMHEGHLAIEGGRDTQPAGELRWHRRGRPHGRFAHRLRVPGAVDAGRIAAEYKHGVLTVTLPKGEAAKPRRIEVINA